MGQRLSEILVCMHYFLNAIIHIIFHEIELEKNRKSEKFSTQLKSYRPLFKIMQCHFIALNILHTFSSACKAI